MRSLEGFCLKLLLFASLCLTLVAVTVPHWAEGPSSTHLGLLQYCNIDRCDVIPETMKSAARKISATLFLMGAAVEFITIVVYRERFLSESSDTFALFHLMFFTSCCLIIAVIIYYIYGLKGLSGHWTLGISYNHAISKTILVIFNTFVTWTQYTLSGELTDETLWTIFGRSPYLSSKFKKTTMHLLEGFCLQLLFIASLCLTLVAVAVPHWAEGPNSTHLGLFQYCTIDRCDFIPETMKSGARKSAAALFLTGSAVEFVSIVVFQQSTKVRKNISVLFQPMIFTSCCFIIAIIIYYTFGLKGMSGHWTLGISYNHAISKTILVIFNTFITWTQYTLSGETSGENLWTIFKHWCSAHWSSCRDKQSVFLTGLPKEWEPMGKETMKIVVIRGEEYKKVMTRFSAALRKKVLKIERVQNPMLYKQFRALKDTVKTRLRNAGCAHLIMTNFLFHGTSYDSVRKICKDGFDRSHCGKNGTKYGKGVYFAKKASYSYNYTEADKDGLRRMILAEVTTGYYTLGNSNMNVVPIKPNGDPYDSVVNKINDPEIYVVYKDASAYPLYIITFN